MRTSRAASPRTTRASAETFDARQRAREQRLHESDELAAFGVRRISVGGALARSAWAGFLAAAEEIARNGTFTALGRAASGAALNERFHD